MNTRLGSNLKPKKIAVVIPAFKVRSQILEVVTSIGPEVRRIIVVDDACPEKSGDLVAKTIYDPRVEIIFHQTNLGVGGAVKSGYRRALQLGYDIVVKIDGDGQMDPSRIKEITRPLIAEIADYAKGNRFFDIDAIRKMPKFRILGNLVLSFFTKLSSGYWRIFDPNNGYTAITQSSLRRLNLDKIDDGYFFESDMLFRLNLVNSRVRDIAMPAIYNDEVSNLKISRVLFEFPLKHLKNLAKRIAYNYYLKDFNLASIELPAGILLSSFGVILGVKSWIHSISNGIPTQPGTIVLVAISLLAGLQLILAFFSFDIGRESNGE